MKKLRNLSLAIAACLILVIAGCTVATPVVTTQPDGTLTTNTIHSVDPKLEQALAIGQGVNTATAPVNPVSPLLTGVITLLGAGATWMAAKKNKEANAERLAADSLAEAIVNLGSQAIDHANKVAGANGVTPTVAKHLDYNTAVEVDKPRA